MIVFRAITPLILNVFANHPSIRPTIEGGDYEIDTSDFVGDARNVCLVGIEGALLFQHYQPGHYKAHVMILKGSRGVAGLAFGRACLNAMFTHYGASKIVAEAPLCLPGVAWYARRVGFTSQGRHPEKPAEVFVMGMKQ